MPDQAQLLPGPLDLLILRAVSLGPLHGYGVLLRIGQISANALVIEQGALYPGLFRLVRQGLFEANWGTSDNNRRGKFYELTATGRKRLGEETETWNRLATAIASALSQQPEEVMKLPETCCCWANCHLRSAGHFFPGCGAWAGALAARSFRVPRAEHNAGGDRPEHGRLQRRSSSSDAKAHGRRGGDDCWRGVCGVGRYHTIGGFRPSLAFVRRRHVRSKAIALHRRCPQLQHISRTFSRGAYRRVVWPNLHLA